jgi:hypothetical protein
MVMVESVIREHEVLRQVSWRPKAAAKREVRTNSSHGDGVVTGSGGAHDAGITGVVCGGGLADGSGHGGNTLGGGRGDCVS